eukprot:gnl/MRDRNA2_/MRDRNA2_108944_c0_seq1.p1 gnl/MRDRNA2_/MRDRNA2_108944_c0~~gnl/MRDRNA2_/MRDRNA2_108944_c0_seq1.p1  ORF type:complete len:414 (-),score=70.09 gnl/MRDRNA2_/MRDRNA2_108944_c0_seq1:4-1245(-)
MVPSAQFLLPAGACIVLAYAGLYMSYSVKPKNTILLHNEEFHIHQDVQQKESVETREVMLNNSKMNIANISASQRGKGFGKCHFSQNSTHNTASSGLRHVSPSGAESTKELASCWGRNDPAVGPTDELTEEQESQVGCDKYLVNGLYPKHKPPERDANWMRDSLQNKKCEDDLLISSLQKKASGPSFHFPEINCLAHLCCTADPDLDNMDHSVRFLWDGMNDESNKFEDVGREGVLCGKHLKCVPRYSGKVGDVDPAVACKKIDDVYEKDKTYANLIKMFEECRDNPNYCQFANCPDRRTTEAQRQDANAIDPDGVKRQDKLIVAPEFEATRSQETTLTDEKKKEMRAIGLEVPGDVAPPPPTLDGEVLKTPPAPPTTPEKGNKKPQGSDDSDAQSFSSTLPVVVGSSMLLLF